MSGTETPERASEGRSEEKLERTTEQPAGVEPEVDQPGLGRLREAVATRTKGPLADLAGSGRGSQLREDGLAGLNSAISSVPDGMASGLLAGVNPIYGLYACMIGPFVGGIVSSSALMVVATT